MIGTTWQLALGTVDVATRCFAFGRLAPSGANVGWLDGWGCLHSVWNSNEPIPDCSKGDCQTSLWWWLSSGTAKLDSRAEESTCVALGPVCSSDLHLVETAVLFYIPHADVSDDEASYFVTLDLFCFLNRNRYARKKPCLQHFLFLVTWSCTYWKTVNRITNEVSNAKFVRKNLQT